MQTWVLPEGALERLPELGEETVEEDMVLSIPQASDVAECTNDSLPFETTYAVQKLGMHSEIFVEVLLPLSFLQTINNGSHTIKIALGNSYPILYWVLFFIKIVQPKFSANFHIELGTK